MFQSFSSLPLLKGNICLSFYIHVLFSFITIFFASSLPTTIRLVQIEFLVSITDIICIASYNLQDLQCVMHWFQISQRVCFLLVLSLSRLILTRVLFPLFLASPVLVRGSGSKILAPFGYF